MINITAITLRIVVIKLIKRGNDIIGLKVICLDSGCENMEIKDILFCNQRLKILGFLIHEGSYFHNPMVIRFENVKKIGYDGVLIENEGAIEEIWHMQRDYPSFHAMGSLMGIEVMSTNRNNVGLVQDIVIDDTLGQLLGFVLSEGLFDDLMDGRPILLLKDPVDLNRHPIIINNNGMPLILHNTGGLKKILSLE